MRCASLVATAEKEPEGQNCRQAVAPGANRGMGKTSSCPWHPRPDDGCVNGAKTDWPVIAIATGIEGDRTRVRREYAECVWAAGGLPVLVGPPKSDADAVARAHLARVDGLILTGGDDPATEAYGEATHGSAVVEPADRQRFDEALLRAAAEKDLPTLGVCLGMQMMALLAGGSLDQHLPEVVATHADHGQNRTHEVRPTRHEVLPVGWVKSYHHQAVRDAGRMRVVARAHDGVIEAIDDPGRRFWLGVQWHPERTEFEGLGIELFRRLVRAAGTVRG